MTKVGAVPVLSSLVGWNAGIRNVGMMPAREIQYRRIRIRKQVTSPIYRTRSIIVLDRSKNRPGVNE